MWQKGVSLFLCYLLLFACGGVAGKRDSEKSDSDSSFWGTLTYMAVGGGLMAAALPVALPVLGFTSAGIAANSVAASLMSWSAVANGGAVPAGGLVATLQSVGAAGGGSAVMAKIGALLGYTVHKHIENSREEVEDAK
nr:interferon alpha-inducible protein 6 [Manis javanica]XP_017495895.2 interferon alpha-inducible protein 6 [Manis javanica]